MIIKKPVIYVIANKRAKMSAGKLAAQVGHAVSHVFSYEDFAHNKWMSHAHRWLIVLQAMDDVHLMAIRDYLADRGVRSHLVIDEGVNEVRPFTYTALGVEILDKDSAEAAYLGDLKMYRDDPPKSPYTLWEHIKHWWHVTGEPD